MQCNKIISHYKTIGYKINVLKQTACLWSTKSWLATLLSSFIARRWVGLQTLCRFQLKDLSIDEMVGARCFGCLSGPPGYTCWISFAPVFSNITLRHYLCFISFFLCLDLYVLEDNAMIS